MIRNHEVRSALKNLEKQIEEIKNCTDASPWYFLIACITAQAFISTVSEVRHEYTVPLTASIEKIAPIICFFALFMVLGNESDYRTRRDSLRKQITDNQVLRPVQKVYLVRKLEQSHRERRINNSRSAIFGIFFTGASRLVGKASADIFKAVISY